MVEEKLDNGIISEEALGKVAGSLDVNRGDLTKIFKVAGVAVVGKTVAAILALDYF